MTIKRLTDLIVDRKRREIINWNFEHIHDLAESLETSKVPYTGATGTVDLGAQKLITEEVESVGDLLVDCGTQKTILLNEPVWEDLRFPATTINPVGLTAAATQETTDPYMGTLLFDPTTPMICAGQAQLPHSRKLSSPLVFHVHWAPTTTNTGNVLWRLSYMASDLNGTFSGTLTDLDIVHASSGIVGKHQIISFAEVAGIGAAVSTMIMWKLTRVAGDVLDTYTGNARLLEFDIHYQIDTVGSRQEHTK